MDPQAMDVDVNYDIQSVYSTQPDLEQAMEFEIEGTAEEENEARKTHGRMVSKMLNSPSLEPTEDTLKVLKTKGTFPHHMFELFWTLINCLAFDSLGVMQVVMSHVTRLDYKSTPDKLMEDCSLQEQVAHARHHRNVSDVRAIRRSYNVMQIIEYLINFKNDYYIYELLEVIGTHIHPDVY
jgi:hypothetical protein